MAEIDLFSISPIPSKISIISNSVTSADASSLNVIRAAAATWSIKISFPSSKLLCVIFKQVKQVNLETSTGISPISDNFGHQIPAVFSLPETRRVAFIGLLYYVSPPHSLHTKNNKNTNFRNSQDI